MIAHYLCMFLYSGVELAPGIDKHRFKALVNVSFKCDYLGGDILASENGRNPIFGE
jgi:hypothetical protein